MGFDIAMQHPRSQRPTIDAHAVGSPSAIDYAPVYEGVAQASASDCRTAGLRFMLAEMAVRTEAARTLSTGLSVIDSATPEGELTIAGDG